MSFNDPQLWIWVAFGVCLSLFGFKSIQKIKRILDSYIQNIEDQFSRAKDLCRETQEKLSKLQDDEKALLEENIYNSKKVALEVAHLERQAEEKIKELRAKYHEMMVYEENRTYKSLKERLLKELSQEVSRHLSLEVERMSSKDKNSFFLRQMNQLPDSVNPSLRKNSSMEEK